MNLTDIFPESDDLDATFNAPVDHARQAQVAAATEQKIGFVENCPKCRGRGTVTIGYRYARQVPCFGCKGKGKLTFKTSSETRSRNRVTAAARHQAKIDAFAAEHPAIWAWMQGNTFEFAAKMLAAVQQYGHLTDNQTAACYRCVAKRDEARATAQSAAQARVAAAPVIEMAKIEEGFQNARQHLLTPKLKIAGLVISYAPATGKNAGALYVKADGTYAGKIVEGRFLASRECTEEMKARLLATAADPKAAAIAYGKEFGVCSCCNRTLTDPVSIAAGIGPICASNWGW